MRRPDVVKAAWGAKRTCHGCGARFYDLNKDKIVCPKCGHTHDADDFLKARRARSSAVPATETGKKAPAAPKIKAPPTAPLGDDDLPAVEGDDDEAIEDTDDLAEDDEIAVDIESDKDETER
jgi:uncharacterized protein (TIGR02300 family)